jgi:phosphate transport system substrate-binding protein
MTIRQDGVYVPSGENDNLIVQKLERNKDAFGIFGYSFLAENADKVIAAKIDSKLPTPETIADGSYPVSRSLYFYVKKSHLSEVKALKPYIDMFMSEKMISEKGILKTIGLIPMAKDLRNKLQTSVANLTPLTVEMVKARTVTK